jgi:hypothetical protein
MARRQGTAGLPRRQFLYDVMQEIDMPKRLSLVLGSILAGVLTCLAAAEARQVASNTERESFTAFAVNISNVGRPGATTVDIVIERYSTKAESQRLLQVFKEKGPDALLDALRDTPRVGYIRTPDSLAYDLHYAEQAPGEDGGRTIMLLTDRPIGFWEAVNRPRTIDYPFTMIQLQLDRTGEGVGKLSIATRITLNGPVLALEDFANQPVMLTQVRKRQ